MPGYFYAPPPARIGGSQPYAPRLGLVQSGPTPQAPPIRGPLALATLTILVSAWTPPYVRAQSSSTVAPTLPAAPIASNPPPNTQQFSVIYDSWIQAFFVAQSSADIAPILPAVIAAPLAPIRQPHIAASWIQDQPTVIYLTQIAAQSIVPDAPPVIQTAPLQTILRSWIPPYIGSQGYSELAPLIQAPIVPDQPPILTRINERIIGQSWIPPWYGPPRPLSTSALPSGPIASAPPTITRVNDRTIQQSWAAAYIPSQGYADIAPYITTDVPPPTVNVVLHSILEQWKAQQWPQQADLSVVPTFAPVVVVSTGARRIFAVRKDRKLRF